MEAGADGVAVLMVTVIVNAAPLQDEVAGVTVYVAV